MSTITNVHGLPQSIVAAVTNDPYTGGGDISATKLIDAPQIRTLMAKHKDQITTDVSERIWSLLGQAVHTILERAALRQEGMVAEDRLYAANMREHPHIRICTQSEMQQVLNQIRSQA